MDRHEGYEALLEFYDEDEPLESGKRLARLLILASVSVELQTSQNLGVLHEHKKSHPQVPAEKKTLLQQSYRHTTRMRKEARQVRRNLTFALSALDRGETRTLVDFLHRNARFSREEEPQLAFRSFIIEEPIEPDQYHELLRRLQEIDAGPTSLH